MSTFKFGVAVIVLATALNPPANITVARARSLARRPNTRLRFLAVAVCSKLLT